MSLKVLLPMCLAEIVLVSMIIGSRKSNEQEILAKVETQKCEREAMPVSVIGRPIDERSNEVKYGSEFVGMDDIPLTADEQELMQQICKETGVDYAFALAMMESESHFIWQVGDLHLKNHAIGYFQISQINEERMEKDYGLDIYDPFENIEAGVRMIAELEAKYDTKTQVIMAYKAGEAGAKKLIEQGVILECVEAIKNRTYDFEAELKTIKGEAINE